MARKTTTTPVVSGPALLMKPREEVRAQLLARVEATRDFLGRSIRNDADLEEFRASYTKWNEFNVEYLRRAFSTSEYADAYNRIAIAISSAGFQSIDTKAAEWAKRVVQKRDRLVSLIERLDLIDEKSGVNVTMPPAASRLDVSAVSSDKVFVVHGQDDAAKAVVARFISACGLEPIILHEQANGGRTIIEKFEKEADVGFAVILMTPDDVGGIRRGESLESDELKVRARQNVVLELGYFAGRLGRGRVAALKKGDLEMPSDIAGVVWTAMDAADAWKMSLARELKAAGFKFDLGRALGI